MVCEPPIQKPPNRLVFRVERANGEVELYESENARTNAGAQAIANLISGSGGSLFTYLALSTTALTPAMGDTTLAGEITTPSGLARQASSFGSYVAPTTVNGACSYVLSATFTNNGTSAVTVASVGCFTAATGGTLGFESNLVISGTSTQTTVSLNPGDVGTLSWQFSA